MFTGIVEERGSVMALDIDGDSARITVRGALVTSDTAHGQSIAVNGCCLTVIDQQDDTFTADVMLETLSRTNLGSLRPGMLVNLERPVRVGDRLSGHVVQGHVDATVAILDRQPAAHWELVRLALPTEQAQYVVAKGSVAIDGVSLTVVDAAADWFTVSLIPETLAVTTLGSTAVGGLVNLEFDIFGKYVERLNDVRTGNLGSTEEQT